MLPLTPILIFTLTSMLNNCSANDTEKLTAKTLHEEINLATKIESIAHLKKTIHSHKEAGIYPSNINYFNNEENILLSALKVKNPQFLQEIINSFKNNPDSLLQIIQTTQKSGMCALSYAAHHCSPEHLKIIIAAYEQNNTTLLEKLSHQNPDDSTNILLSSLWRIAPKTFQILVQAYGNKRDKLFHDLRIKSSPSGFNCLLKIIEQGNFELFKIIITIYEEHSPSTLFEDLRYCTSRKCNALNLAAINSNCTILHCIIKKYEGHERELLEDLSIQYTWSDMNALMEAIYQKRVNNIRIIIQALLQANNQKMIGRILSSRDRFNKRALELACDSNDCNIITLITALYNRYAP